MAKFGNQDGALISKTEVCAIIRRMSDHTDGKISFREFSVAITPELAGLPDAAAGFEFNKEAKKQHEKQMRDSPTRSAKSIRGAFRQIQLSPSRHEFKQLPLKTQENPDTKYVLDMVKMGSPSRDKDALKHSHRVL
jgi:hypothetical protein